MTILILGKALSVITTVLALISPSSERCPVCSCGFPPLGEELGLLQEAMAWLGAKLPYEQAREEISQFCHTLVSEPTLRRHTSRNG